MSYPIIAQVGWWMLQEDEAGAELRYDSPGMDETNPGAGDAVKPVSIKIDLAGDPDLEDLSKVVAAFMKMREP